MNDANPKTDPEMAEFEAAVMCSIEQLQSGDYAVVTTPAQMAARSAARCAATSKLTLTQTFTEMALAQENWSEFEAANADGLDKLTA